MSVFDAYARYYDLLYRDKDYAAEAAYVDRLIQRYCPGASRVLELGCGTGRHGVLLAQKGYRVTGVDRSERMVEQAQARARDMGCRGADFLVGDIRSLHCGDTFDAVISLFHVVSYQTTNEDLAAVFTTAASHLRPGGVFIFDCWYGPAVLTQKPEVRVKRMEDEAISILRIAEPVLRPNENTVDVNYTVFIKEKATGLWRTVNETHIMRYLFAPEVEAFMNASGFHAVAHEEWMTGRQPSEATWGTVFAGRRTAGIV